MVKLCSASVLLPIVLALFVREWLHVAPRVDWSPKTVDNVITRVPVRVEDLPQCPKGKTPLLIFGATSMLGRYIMDTFSEVEDLCIISYARSKCEKCDISVRGDLRDVRYVKRVIEHYRPETILTSVKPPLLGIHYKVYIELNLLSMVELVKLAKSSGVKYFIYVSSIAASGHYHPHHMATEDHDVPYYTDFEAPYDVSKRFAEDYLLGAHEEGKFNVVSIRTGGIIGGEGDPYEYLRFPILGGFEPSPPRVDSNYAANIADALAVVYQTLKRNSKVGGQFYYYTGEPISETEKARLAARAQGKLFITLPLWMLEPLADFLHWIRWDPLTYNFIDLIRMGIVEQTFNQTKFHNTFTSFKPKWKLKEAIKEIYSK